MTESNHTSSPPLRFAVIGGDLRMTYLCHRLMEEDHTVRALGCGEDCLSGGLSHVEGHGKGEKRIRICTSLQSAVEGADALILPLPATRDGITVHCPRDPACTVTLKELGELVERTPGLSLFGGKLPADFLNAVRQNTTADTLAADYYESELLQLRNAYLTAEAAIMTAMELTDASLRDTPVAIVGYGRIGRFLARLLRAWETTVTVCARREEQLFEAAAAGCRPLRIDPDAPFGGLSSLREDTAVLFNTVPAQILPRDLLMGLKRDTLLIDLSSAPFGVNDRDVREATAENGLRYLRAPSLPGSYAPRDAGRIIADCILESLSRIGEEVNECQRQEGGNIP